jgi:hypothetical protein
VSEVSNRDPHVAAFLKNWVNARFRHYRLLRSGAAAGLAWSWPARASAPPAPFPVHFRKSNPYEKLRAQLEPGHDEFAVEQEAAATTARWNRLPATGAVPLAGGFHGSTPMPARYQEIATGVFTAEFDRTDNGLETGMAHWIAKLGAIRSARFFVLANDRLRYEIAGTAEGSLQYRVGIWRRVWRAAVPPRAVERRQKRRRRQSTGPTAGAPKPSG